MHILPINFLCNKASFCLSSVMILVLGTCSAVYAQQAVQKPTPAKVPVIPLRPGFVSLEGAITYENYEKLTPTMKEAVGLLRAGQAKQALSVFLQAQRERPSDPLAYRGENESAYKLGTLDNTARRYRHLIAHVKSSGPLAAIHYALGDALMLKNYNPRYIGDNPRSLGPEPVEQFNEALRLNPKLVVVYLALATYYEHPSQEQGTKARDDYDKALELRPDLFQIRYLHAASWDRPGYVPPSEEERLRDTGYIVPADHKKMPESAISEYLSLIKNKPLYPPPYKRLGEDYAWPIGNNLLAQKYETMYNSLVQSARPSSKR